MRPGERLNEILFTSQEPTIEIGIPGIMAAKPNYPPLDVIRKWTQILKTAIANDDRTVIKSVLVDAVPEFGGQHQPVGAAAQTGTLLPTTAPVTSIDNCAVIDKL
jgi:FlaA1/EpsC-like NDP-sugar epimerase